MKNMPKKHIKAAWISFGLSLSLAFALLGSVPGAQAQETPIVIVTTPVSSLDPAQARGTNHALTVLSQVYSSLTTIQPDGTLAGDLAESWQVNSPTEFTFKLRSGATFENGEPLDANTVVWNFKRMNDPAVKAAANTGFDNIVSLTAADATTVVIRTKTPWLDLPRRLSWWFFIEPKWAEKSNPKVEVNASGAYRLVSYEVGGDIVLKRNPDFYGSAPAFENVVYRGIGSMATRIAGIRAGEITASLHIDPLDLPQLENLPDYRIGARAGQRYQVLKFNYKNSALADVRVRKAINYAIDKGAITKVVFRGHVEAGTTQVFSPETEGYDSSLAAWPYDPQKARALLAEAGYADGLKLGLTTTAEGQFVSVAPIVQILADQLSKVGITVTINLIPNSAWNAIRNLTPEEAPDITYVGFTSQANTAAELLRQYTSKSPLSFGPQPTRFDDAVAKVENATDTQSMIAAAHEASRIAVEDALVGFLWLQPQTYAVSKRVNWSPRSDDWIRATEMKPN